MAKMIGSNEDVEERVKQLYLVQGLSIQKIAKELKIQPYKVAWILGKLGIELREARFQRRIKKVRGVRGTPMIAFRPMYWNIGDEYTVEYPDQDTIIVRRIRKTSQS